MNKDELIKQLNTQNIKPGDVLEISKSFFNPLSSWPQLVRVVVLELFISDLHYLGVKVLHENKIKLIEIRDYGNFIHKTIKKLTNDAQLP